MRTKLAGVTFNNDPDDGGRNRQEILAELYNGGRQIFTADLIYTKYKDEFAVKVRDHLTKQILGWIPKSDLEMFKDKKTRQLTGFIRWHGGYHVQLDTQHAPTHKQYAYMKFLCEQNGYTMPAYDKRAYAGLFAILQLEVKEEN